MAAEFAVMNDQSGDQKDVTLKEWEKLQGQGYRIVDVAAYDNAVAADAAPRESQAQPRSEAPKSEAQPKPAEAKAAEPVRGDKPKS